MTEGTTDLTLPKCELKTRRLASGQACKACRRRKSKCDGQKVTCGLYRQKRKDDTVDECEYRDLTVSIASNARQTIENALYRQNLKENTVDECEYRNLTVSTVPNAQQSIEDAMLHAFRPHASEFGFFLDWEWFRSGTRHSSALLNAIYMWGAHISSDRHREQHFMRKALRCAAGELTPTSFMRSIQAEVLLSFFFFRTDCLLEARAHSAKAVTLVIAGRLHQIGSLTQSDWTAADIAVVDGRKLLLPAPANAFEEGDRINGFWAVFVLQQSLFVVLEPSTPACGVFDSGAGGINIDTPWPLDTCDARQEVYGESTVRNYLSGLPDCQVVPSVAAMSVKASILFHHAVLMHRKWRPNLPEPETASWWAAFHVTNQLIDALLSELPNASQLRGRSSPRTIMLSRSLLHAATIKLHSVFDDASSKQIRLPAAQAMSSLDGVTLHELEYVSPLIPTLWAMGSSVLVQDMGWVGAANLVPQACPTPASSRPSSSRKSEKPVVAVTFPAAAFD